MCEVRFNMTDDELRTRVTTYLANIHQLRNQLRNQHRSQFIDKAVSIRRNAYCSGERSSLLLQKIEIL